jgi:hypothetical protein
MLPVSASMPGFIGLLLELIQKMDSMKKIRSFLRTAGCVMTVLFITTAISFAQDEKAAAVKNMIETQQFIFKAETVSPASGRIRQLTPDYDLKVSKDTIVAYLPYFGKSYSAPIDINDVGIKFTSVKFDYTLSKGKKNRYEIIIKPKDQTEVEELSLTVWENGSSTLRVIGTNRQPISFNGYISTK